MKFYPYVKRGGAETVLAMLKGRGHNKFSGSSYTVACFSHVEVGDKKFPLFKGGREKFYPVLRGCPKSFGPAIFPFCSPPPPLSAPSN